MVKDEQTPFVNRKADGLPEAKATKGSVDFSFSLTHVHGIYQRTRIKTTTIQYDRKSMWYARSQKY